MIDSSFASSGLETDEKSIDKSGEFNRKKVDSESLDHLLRGGHYNVPERINRGIWPNPLLQMSDLVAYIMAALDRDP